MFRNPFLFLMLKEYIIIIHFNNDGMLELRGLWQGYYVWGDDIILKVLLITTAFYLFTAELIPLA